MSEQEQAPDEGTPENAGTVEEAPGTQTAEQAVDYEKRYNDMRSEFDRRGSRVTELEAQQAAIADLRSDDLDTRTRAAQALGLPFEFVDDSPDADEYQDPSEALAREIAAIKEQLAGRDQEAAHQAQIAQIEQHVEQKLTSLGDLDEKTRKRIVNDAVALPPTPEGMPDIDTAYREFQEWEMDRQKAWRESKRAPAIKAGGQVGTQAVPVDATHSQRVAAMLEALDAQQ